MRAVVLREGRLEVRNTADPVPARMSVPLAGPAPAWSGRAS